MLSLLLSGYTCLVLFGYVNSLGTPLITSEVFVEVMAPIFTEFNQNSDTCSNIDVESVQTLEAIRWIMNRLNSDNYFPWGSNGLGVRYSSTCGSKDKAEKLAYNLAVELNASGHEIVGLLGPDFSSEAEAVSRLLSALPEDYRLLQLSHAATSASLRNRDIYKNFYRTIPADDIQTTVMTSFMEQLNWTYIAIIYDDDTYGRGGRDALLQDALSRDICYPILIGIDVQNYNLDHIEDEIRNKLINASVPVGGAIVFGSYSLADNVLKATENVLADFPDKTTPIYLFSEAGGYLEGQHVNVSKGIFVVSPPKTIINDFQTHWYSLFENVGNIYSMPDGYRQVLMVLYKEQFGCELTVLQGNNNCPGVDRALVAETLPISIYTQYAIQAAMTIAKVTKLVHNKNCGPNALLCSAFNNAPRKDFIDTMIGLSVSFDNDFGNVRIPEFQGNPDLEISFNDTAEAEIPPGLPTYEIYNHQTCVGNDDLCLKKVAELKTSRLEVFRDSIKDYNNIGEEQSWPNIRKAQCPDSYTCTACLTITETDTSIFFQDGDMYVVGIVPVHNPGTTPLECGDVKQGGFDIAEAIRFAIINARESYNERIPQGKIGVIIIDSCNDPAIVQEKVLTLHRSGILRNGENIQISDKIIGYIGGWTSSVSTEVAAVTTQLDFVQISYASTAISLGDQIQYPYFLRTPTPDNFQAEIMLNIVKILNTNLIQILYSETTYGKGGRDSLLNLVGDLKICVAQVLGVERDTTTTQILASLRQNQDARLVLVFMGSTDLQYHLQNINSLVKPNEFTFIGSEAWGTRFDLSGNSNLVGAITLASELPINSKFKDHLKAVKPDGSNSNPWIRPYMENYFDCYYQWSYDKISGRQCSGTESLDAFSTTVNYKVDAWAPFTERAVLALLLGARTALDSQCGNSNEICDAYRNNPNVLFDAIKVLEFTSESGTFTSRAFYDNGDGRAGFRIYAVSSTGRYTLVGSSELQTANAAISFQRGSYPGPANINSSCATQSYCQVCFPPPPLKEEEDSLSIGLIIVIVILAVICCALAGVLLFICNRLGFCLRIENGRPKFNESYITPVYLQRHPDGSQAPTSIRDGTSNYAYIDDMYPQKAQSNRYGGSQSSANRQSPLGGPIDSGMNTAPSSHTTSGSQQSSGSQPSFGSSMSGSGVNPDYLTMKDAPIASGGQVTIPEENSQIQKVIYQKDGSYITTGSISEQDVHNGLENRDVSDQSMRLPSTESDKSLGYLRSVQTINNQI